MDFAMTTTTGRYTAPRFFPQSFTSLDSFDYCPAKYERSYFWDGPKSEFGAAAQAGNRMHSLLEARCMTGVMPPMEVDTDHVDYVRDYSERMNVEKVAQWAEGAARACKGTLYAEFRAAIGHDGKRREYKDRDSAFRLKSDVVIASPELLVAADLKTGKPKRDSMQLRYTAAALITSGWVPMPKKVMLAYIHTNPEHTSPPPEIVQGVGMEATIRTWYDEFMGKVKKVNAAVAAGNFPPRTSPGFLCGDYCDRIECSLNGKNPARQRGRSFK